VKTNKPLEMVDVINVMSFLLQVGFMLFYYKKAKLQTVYVSYVHRRKF